MMDDADSLVECPYNPSHIIYQSRLQTHLSKCSWAHQNPQQNVEPKIMKVCRYNSNHHVPAAELDHHHAICKDMSSVVRFSVSRGAQSVVPYVQIDVPSGDENWDNEEYHSTYNPEQRTTSSVIIRQKQGVPKSVRKNFRMQERERINRLREEQEALEKSAHKNPQPKPAPVENTAFSESRLRQPRSALLGMGRGRIVQSSPGQHSRIGLALGGDFGLQDIPSIYDNANGNNMNRMCSPPNGMHSPPSGMRSPSDGMYSLGNGTSSTSNGGTYSEAMDTQSSSSPDGAMGPLTGSCDAPDFCAVMLSDMTVEDDAFIEVGKKNKKKAQPAKVHGYVPASSQPANPLMNGSFKHALPGQPGKGRGRLTEN